MSCSTTPASPWVRAAETCWAELRWRIGVDGGGTGTRLELRDRSGTLLGRGQAGPSALGQGVGQAWRHVMQALEMAREQAGLAALTLGDCAIGLGLSGVNVAQQALAFVDARPGFGLLVLDSDGYAGVLGAHAGQPGAVLVSGTGSVGEALRRDGSRVCVGGWGWAIGDEGSGAWLGRKAIQHAQRAQDGRAIAGTLARALHKLAGADRESVLAWCAAAGQQAYASLAPLVFEHRDIDPVAAQFVDTAVLELEGLVAALDPAGELPLALSGSIAKRLAPHFSAATRARCVAPRGDAVAGALLLIDQALATAPAGQKAQRAD